MEPLSGQLVIAKSAFQAGTAAIQLSNTVIGRLKVRRMVAAVEEQAIRYWLQEQLAEFKITSDMVLDRRVQDAVATVWENYYAAAARVPGAEADFAVERQRAIWRIMQNAGIR